MTINQAELKHSKHLFGQRIPNEYGLDIRLFVMADPNYVGAIIVSKELKSHFKGHLVRMSHDEYKSGCLKTLKGVH